MYWHTSFVRSFLPLRYMGTGACDKIFDSF